MAKQFGKKNVKVTNIDKKQELTNFEIIEFLQYEYNYQKQRMRDFVDRTQLLLAWNAGVFAFAIMFTDIGSIVRKINLNSQSTYLVMYSKLNSNIVIMIDIFVVILITSIIIIAISSFGFFISLETQEIYCFSMETYFEDGFKMKEILKDYNKILTSYDDDIERYAKRIDKYEKCQIIGIVILLISELVLKLLVNL